MVKSIKDLGKSPFFAEYEAQHPDCESVGHLHLCECDKHNPPFQFKTLIKETDTDETINGLCPECRRIAQQKEIDEQNSHAFENYLLQTVHVPADAITATFDNLEPNRECQKWEQEDMYLFNCCKTMVKPYDMYEDRNIIRTMLVIGCTGSGKTYPVCAMLKEAVKQGKTCRYIPDDELRVRYQATFKKGAETLEFTKEYNSYDFLVVDDVEPDKWKQVNSSFLAQLIITRSSNYKRTILLTNRKQEEIFTGFGDVVRSRILAGLRPVLTDDGTGKRDRRARRFTA